MRIIKLPIGPKGPVGEDKFLNSLIDMEFIVLDDSYEKLKIYSYAYLGENLH